MDEESWSLGTVLWRLTFNARMDDLNPYSMQVICTSRKDDLLSCSFSIVNCIDDWIKFTWSSSIWTSSWWGQRMNVSFMYLSHNIWYDSENKYLISCWRHEVYKSQKFSLYCLVRTHGAVDKVFCWKVFLNEIIWRLQVQSQLQLRITRNTYYNLTLVPGHG